MAKTAPKWYNAALISFALLITLAAVLSGPYFQGGYTLEVGIPSPAKFVAPRETVNESLTERLRQEARSKVGASYTENKDATQLVIDKMNEVFDYIAAERMRRNPITTPYGVQDGSQGGNPSESAGTAQSPVTLTSAQLQRLAGYSTDEYNNFRSQLEERALHQLELGIREDGVIRAVENIRDEMEATGYDSTDLRMATIIMNSCLQANLVQDVEATQRNMEEAAAAVAPVMIQAGEMIVDESVIITEDIFQILDSLGYTGRKMSESVWSVVSVLVVITVALAALLIYIFFNQHWLVNNIKQSGLLLTFYCLAVVGTWALSSLPWQFSPIMLAAMLITIFIDSRLSLVVSFCLAVVCSFIIHGDINFIIYFAVMSMFSSSFARFLTERSKVFSTGVIISLTSVVTGTALSLLFMLVVDLQELMDQAVYCVLNGILTVSLVIGTLPFWEAIFRVVTPIKLLDLANPSNKLLRRLIMEAPGTYHHSLIVSNLSETAAYDIGADPLLAKVGGYYHDIGKLRYPDYFSENIVGPNPHDRLSPSESTAVIIEHVTYGLELAKEYKLPSSIRQFIAEHHGTTVLKFFYYKAQKEAEEKGETACQSDYRYKFGRPSCRETAIVMLADTVEAAVRSVIPRGKSTTEVEAMVRGLIKDKMDDGQLNDSGLTLTDIENIIRSFLKVFKGLYHERIPYPKAEPEKEEIKAETKEEDAKAV